MVVDNIPAGIDSGFYDLVWRTAYSPALSIWYLFVLFVVSLGFMLLLGGQRARIPFLLGCCVVLYVLPLPPYLYLDRIGTYAVFFGCGAGAGFLGARWDGFMDRRWPVLLAMLFCWAGGRGVVRRKLGRRNYYCCRLVCSQCPHFMGY